MSTEQAKFEGWAIVDVLGHQRYVGYVTTEAYGAAVLFRIDVPELDARERTTVRPGYHPKTGAYLPAGTLVTEGAVDGYTKLIGAGSIYSITPCEKAAALKAVEEAQSRPFMSVKLPDVPAIADASLVDAEDPENHYENEDDDQDEAIQ